MDQEDLGARAVLNNLQAQAQNQETLTALRQVEQEMNAAEERINQLQEQLQGHQQQQLEQQQQQQQMQQLQQQLQQMVQLQQQQQPHQARPQAGTLQAAKIKISRPDGFEGKYSDLENFIFRVEQYFLVVGVTDEYEKVRFAVTLLHNNALTWWRAVQSEQWAALGTCDWVIFTTKLRGQFTDVDAKLKARRRLGQLKQTGTVSAYTNAFCVALLEVGEQNISASDIIFIYVEGLQSHVQQHVLLQRPSTFLDACILAECAGSVFGGSWRSNQHMTGKRVPTVATSSHQAVPMELGVISGQNNSRQIDTMTPANFLNVPLLRRVQSARQVAYAPKCTAVTDNDRNQAMSITGDEIMVETQRRIDKLLDISSGTLSAEIDENQNLDFKFNVSGSGAEGLVFLKWQCSMLPTVQFGLLDSGASHNFISRGLAASMRQSIKQNDFVRVQLADGRELIADQSINCIIKIGNINLNLKFYILPLNFDVVFGMPFLKQCNPRIDWAKGKMHVQQSRGWQEIECIVGNYRDVMQRTVQACTVHNNSTQIHSTTQHQYNKQINNAVNKTSTINQINLKCAESQQIKGGVGAANESISKKAAAAGDMPRVPIIGRKEFKCGMHRREFTKAYLVWLAEAGDRAHGPHQEGEHQEGLPAQQDGTDPAGTAAAKTQPAGPSGMLDLVSTKCPALLQASTNDSSPSLSQSALEILMSEFPTVFAQQRFPPPARRVTHRIQLKDPSLPPPRRKLYPLSAEESEELRRQVDLMLADGRIQPSSSPYGAPVLFVKKRDKGLRMVIDYRLLNKNTVAPSFPLPRMEDLLSQLSSATVFSKLDLKDGYHTVRMHEEDQEKTAFTCRLGTFHWTVMPFGLVGAPSTFMHAVTDVFLQCLDRYLVLYMDDLLIYSKSVQDHWKHLRSVFKIMSDNALHVKPSKCQLFADKLEFLGHILMPGGIMVEQSKIEAIGKWPTPTCVKHIQQFLGLCNYYRTFIADFASISAPLSDLTRKNVPFVWTKVEQQAFDELKRALTEAPVLQLPSATADTRVEVHCDASDKAIGAVLLQDIGDGFKPVAYLSKRLNPAETNYPAHERELLAVIVAMKNWRHHLAGRKFVVKTDHQGLKHLQTQPKLSRRQVRWLETFAEFDFSIEYVPGRHNVVPDSLSRRPDLMLHALSATGGVNTDFLDEVRLAQQKGNDSQWQQYLADADKQVNGFVMVNGILCKKIQGKTVVVIPDDSSLKDKILFEYHNTPLGGHLGFYRVLHKLQSCFWWSGMSRYLRSYIAACETCQACKVETRAPAGLLHPLSVPERCWEQISTDLITHLPVSEQGFDSIATFVDRLSKMTYFVPCKSTITAQEYASLMVKNVVRLHGVPQAVISDRDPRFMGNFWRALFGLLGTKLCCSSAYHPQSDGQTERQHRSIEQILRCFVSSNQRDWPDHLSLCEFALNSTRSKTTGKSPFLLNYGVEPQLPIDHAVKALNGCLVESSSQFVTRMKQLLTEARVAISQASVSASLQANKSRREVSYCVGDLVWVRTDHLSLPKSLTRKLAPKFIGPYEIVKVINPVAMQVALPAKYRLHNTFHVSQLKPHIAGSVQQQPPSPVFLEDDQVEYEVEDVLDYREISQGRKKRVEYLIKWKGFPVFESTWEPLSHLNNCQSLVQLFHERRSQP